MNRYPGRLTGRMLVAVVLCEGKGDAGPAQRVVAEGLAWVQPAGPLGAYGEWIKEMRCRPEP
jgi:hypothetical protein